MKMKQPGLLIATLLTAAAVHAASGSGDADVQARVAEAKAVTGAFMKQLGGTMKAVRPGADRTRVRAL